MTERHYNPDRIVSDDGKWGYMEEMPTATRRNLIAATPFVKEDAMTRPYRIILYRSGNAYVVHAEIARSTEEDWWDAESFDLHEGDYFQITDEHPEIGFVRAFTRFIERSQRQLQHVHCILPTEILSLIGSQTGRFSCEQPNEANTGKSAQEEYHERVEQEIDRVRGTDLP